MEEGPRKKQNWQDRFSKDNKQIQKELKFYMDEEEEHYDYCKCDHQIIDNS